MKRSVVFSFVKFHVKNVSCLRLDILPERFREIGLEFGCAEKLRRMVVDNYSVFYVIQEERVIVTNVRYSASGIEID